MAKSLDSNKKNQNLANLKHLILRYMVCNVFRDHKKNNHILQTVKFIGRKLGTQMQ